MKNHLRLDLSDPLILGGIPIDRLNKNKNSLVLNDEVESALIIVS